MKLLITVAAAIAVCSAKVIKDPVSGYKEGDRYFYFPGDGDGLLHLVDAFEPVDEEYITSFTRNPENNLYLLYTRANPEEPQILINGNVKTVRNSNFDFKKTTVFIAHGWNGHGYNDLNQGLREAFLIDGDVNVICLDWSDLANRNYITAKGGAAAVGRGLGQFIIWLNSLGLSYDSTHLVGFSLGGHLVGNAGRETGAKVRRITALDPAGPMWSWDGDRLTENDGQYVEVIHTNTGLLGYTDPCGHADYYPNGGSSQPGCWLNSCSHGRAWEYMAASVKYDHLHANACDSYRDASRDRCTGESHPMGNSNTSKNRTGIFRVNTASSYPY